MSECKHGMVKIDLRLQGVGECYHCGESVKQDGDWYVDGDEPQYKLPDGLRDDLLLAVEVVDFFTRNHSDRQDLADRLAVWAES